jgi:tRNA-Thr(GGU) m(6)t(6)A37 methyltransferase TsaA
MTDKFSTPIQLRPIGYVENGVDEAISPAMIRAVESRIILKPRLENGLKSLGLSSRVMVIFYFHQSEGYELQQHPRGDTSRPKRGVFALRTPRRPNPIGVTVVDLDRVEGNVLFVHGLDAINGTPVLDIKPA